MVVVGDLQEFAVRGSPAAEPANYDLFAISNHMGGLGGGHCMLPLLRSWRMCV